MSIKIYPKPHLNSVLRKLSTLPNYHEGRISWNSGPLEHGTFEVVYNLSFETAVDDYDKDAAIWHALNECARAKNFSASFFVNKLRRYLEGVLGKQVRSFTAIAQVNAQVAAQLPGKIVSVDGPVEIRATLPLTCRRVVDSLEDYERSRLNLQDGFVFLVSKVKSRSERSAVDAAYRNTKYALGIMNLAIHGYGPSKRFGFPSAPIGKFLTASPVFIVDTSDKKLGNWQSENYYPTLWKRNFSVWQAQQPEIFVKFAKNVAADLVRIDFKDRLVQSVLLLQEGLEATSVEMALLKFWTGIEVLCSKEQQDFSERVVERASSIFDDYGHAAMRLRYMQEYRNRVVHRGEAGDHALLCAQYGSAYLGALIRFFLWNIYKFRERDTILDFLSLPLNAKKLENNITLNRTRKNALKRMLARQAAADAS